MQDSLFGNWLAQRYDEGTCSSRLSNCRRIEEFEGDLDQHYARDGMQSLIERLRYSTEDARRRAEPRHRIPIKGDRGTGSATLRSAASLYKDFRDGISQARTKPIAPVTTRKRTEGQATWPHWNSPTPDEVLTLARSVTPYIRFLHPAIVKALVEDTEAHRESWTELLKAREVDASLYLWPKTACAFPGVRCHAGSSEIAQFRRQAEVRAIENAVAIDDNSYPKHIWSFALRGRPYQRFGPDGYALAHLSDHKEYKNRSQGEMSGSDGARTLFGLYTSASNAAFVPTSLIRPTDFVPQLRNLLQRKSHALYGSFCNLLPPGNRFNDVPSPEWETEKFSWSEPVGDIAWIQLFLNYRRDEMTRLLTRS